jgi:ATP-binding cassette, subfamily B, bacterial MsbA
MGRRSKETKGDFGVHYRYYGRLLSYLKHYKLRASAIVVVLVGEALFTVLGLALLKPVLDLVFLGELIRIEDHTHQIPVVIEDRDFHEQGTYVARVGGALDEISDTEPVDRASGWIMHPEIHTAAIDLTPLEILTDQGWAALAPLGLSIDASQGRLVILSEEQPPSDLWPQRLAGLVIAPSEAPELADLVEQVPVPVFQPEEPGPVQRFKDRVVMSVRPQLEGLQAYALQGSWNKYVILIWLSAILIVFTLGRCVCGFFAGYLTGYVSDGMVRRIRDEVYNHMLHLEEGFFSRRNVGTLMTHVMQDVTVTKSSIETIFLGVLKGPINLVVVLVAMIIISPALTLYTLVMFPALMAPMIWVARRVRRYSRRSQEKRSKLNVVLHETLSGMRVVRAYSNEDREVDRFKRENWRLFKFKIRTAMADSFAAQLTFLLSTIAGCAVLLLNGYHILELRTLSGSDFIIFIGLMFTLYRPLKGMTKANNKIIAGMAGAERFFPVLDRLSKIVERPDAVDLSPFRESVRFEGVTFSYGDEPVLRDIDIEIPAGRIVALVGASGSGKTTFVNLLPRFWDPTEGRVLIDGHDLRDVTLHSLRRQIAIVTQESILFDDTVRNNIAYGQKDLDDERIFAAARAANAHDFILDLPSGYDTLIGDRGARLSGGQKQRISIARALVKGSPILILDEATSALDTEAEREVQAAIDRLIKEHTAFVIAHRLSTIVNAHEILVLKEGRIVERGSHADLLAQGGEYAKLYNLQFGSAEAGK